MQASKSGVDLKKIVNIVSIAAGSSHTCAVEMFGTVKCWGSDTSGQLGDGPGSGAKAEAIGPPSVTPAGRPLISGASWRSKTARSNTAKESINDSGFFAIAAGGTGNCANYKPASKGGIGCWGQITFKQVGPDSLQTNDAFQTITRDNFSPTKAYAGRAIGVAMSDFHMCAITANSTVDCGAIRSTGNKVSIPLVTPAISRLAVALPRPAALAVKAVSPGLSVVCALLEDRITCSGIKSATDAAPIIVGDRQEFMIAYARGLTIDGTSLCAIRDTGAIACGSLGLLEVSSSNSASGVVSTTYAWDVTALSDVPSATAIRRATAVVPGLRDKPVTASLTNGATTLTVTR
jgi:Regulator of chromosome condensation (RCC1) repeat